MKVCGVAVAMLQGHSWAPTLSNGWKVNVGTILLVLLPASIWLVGGKARCRLMPVGWGGGPVVVRDRESRSHGEGVFAADVLIAEVAGEWWRTVARPLRGWAAGTCDADDAAPLGDG